MLTGRNAGSYGSCLRACVFVVVIGLVVTACSSDVTQSEEYQALEAELEELASSQAETASELVAVESQLASAEVQIQSVQDQLAEAEERTLELEAVVGEFLGASSVMDFEGPTEAQPNPDDGVTIYGDGEISCPDHRASIESLPVGTITYRPDEGEIGVTITLTGAAPNVSYAVELWTNDSCSIGGPLTSEHGIRTDGNGAGELEFTVTGLDPGSYALNVNLSTGSPHEDPRHREMGTAQFTEVVVR